MAENTEQRLARINRAITDSVIDFNKILEEFTDKIAPEMFVTFQKRIVLELLRRVVLKTPVDTGRARGNWQIEVGSPPSGVLEVVAQGAEAEARDISSADAGRVIADALAKLGKLGFGEVVWVANNLDYVVFLEEGSSDQAPAGMMRVSLEEMREIREL